MRKVKFQSLCLIFLLLFCVALNSCKVPGNILQRSSEVDFSTPQKVQISFNENIYNITVVLNGSKLEINYIDEKDLMSGAYVCLTDKNYKMTYKDMVFNGEKTSLTNSFLPCIIYNFIFSFEDKIILDSYDKEQQCYSIEKNVNGYFITFECYETESDKIYSMEIK